MKTVFTIFCLLFFTSTTLRSETPYTCCTDDPYFGYIITLDGKILTGQIGEIFYSDAISLVVFVNDFGTPYHLQAELINGFVYRTGGEMVEYESLYRGRTRSWSFLQVLHRGTALSLFKSPEEKIQFSKNPGENYIQGRTVELQEYWLKFKGERSFKVGRIGYKRALKKHLKEYPAIAKKLGKQGYKFKDLQQIVEKINHIYDLRVRTL